MQGKSNRKYLNVTFFLLPNLLINKFKLRPNTKNVKLMKKAFTDSKINKSK